MSETPCMSDPDSMFPAATGTGDLDRVEREVAHMVCGHCPLTLKAACLEYTLDHETVETRSFGVAGGLTSRQRRGIINARKAEAAKQANKPRAEKAACGTVGGHSKHRRDGTPICAPCRAADTERMREYRAARQAVSA